MYVGQNPKKVGKDMSFVGMHIMQGGIIAFADSKATVIYENGFKVEDLQRSPVQKIFKNDNFILVTHGNNEIFSTRNKQNIEDYLHEKVKSCSSVKDFIIQFHSDASKDIAEYNDGIYHFIIGTKLDDRFFIYDISIDINEPLFFEGRYNLPKPIYQGYVIGGNQTYMDIYKLHQFYYNVDINEYSNHIKQVVEHIIKLENCFTQFIYNSVGLPVNIEIFQ